MKFVDEATIYVKAGNGGNGCSSFRREKYAEFGGPDGGNGGNGGNVVVDVDNAVNSLAPFLLNSRFFAEDGEKGHGAKRHGANARDLVVKVPIGTQILNNYEDVVFDAINDKTHMVLAVGGRGGRGNATFKSSINRAPREFTYGAETEELIFKLSLKLCSDCAIVGLPNAGKSTFINAITAANSKVGDYTFTTINPVLGSITRDYFEIVIADIPGLLEGAHKNIGLGLKFLKHIERTKILLHILDASNDDFITNYLVLRKELEIYGNGVNKKDEMVILNKCDLINNIDGKISIFRNLGVSNIFAISAANSIGTEDIVNAIFVDLKKDRQPESYDPFVK